MFICPPLVSDKRRSVTFAPMVAVTPLPSLIYPVALPLLLSWMVCAAAAERV